MTDRDITELLRGWAYEPGRINVRRLDGADGRPKLQIRLELGVLQLEMEGRPDGHQPEGYESLLHLQRKRIHRYIEQNGSELGFVISREECRAIREEVVQYYHRYVALFALGEYEGVIRDTARNLDALDLCHRFGETADDRNVMEHLRSPVITMRTRAEAEIAIARRHPKQAINAIDRGLGEIRRVFEEAGLADGFEQSNEVQLLRSMRDMLIPKLPASQRAELHERLQSALDAENYELAAILRDELRLMRD